LEFVQAEISHGESSRGEVVASFEECLWVETDVFDKFLVAEDLARKRDVYSSQADDDLGPAKIDVGKFVDVCLGWVVVLPFRALKSYENVFEVGKVGC
jgi:hypothetical protein